MELILKSNTIKSWTEMPYDLDSQFASFIPIAQLFGINCTSFALCTSIVSVSSVLDLLHDKGFNVSMNNKQFGSILCFDSESLFYLEMLGLKEKGFLIIG